MPAATLLITIFLSKLAIPPNPTLPAVTSYQNSLSVPTWNKSCISGVNCPTLDSFKRLDIHLDLSHRFAIQRRLH